MAAVIKNQELPRPNHRLVWKIFPVNTGCYMDLNQHKELNKLSAIKHTIESLNGIRAENGQS